MSNTAGGLTIRPNPLISGSVSFDRANLATRSATNDPIANLLQSSAELVEFSSPESTRSLGAAANLLVIDDLEVKDEAALRESPVQIELSETLGVDEVIFPVTHDGEFYRVVGESVVEESGQTVVNIRELPNGTSVDGETILDEGEKSRGIGNALKLAFFKLALGVDDINKLCWNEFLEDGEVTRHKEGVAEKVASADNILILIHGIIGATNDISTGIAKVSLPDGSPLQDAYDLVLSYDYENLNTSISDTGLAFKKALLEAGLHRDDGKEVTILAHSMGGLVSRWMIEQEQGNEFIDRLILAGTPNHGSNFGKIESARSFAVVVLDLAMNFIPSMVPFAATALKILKAPTQVLVTLGEMEPSSDFITKLNASKDPGVPYLIVGGNALVFEVDEESGKFARFMEQATLKVGDLVNPGRPHDIAVELDSVFNRTTEGWSARQPAPLMMEPACHHLNYFHSEEGMNALMAIGLGGNQSSGTTIEEKDPEPAEGAAALVEKVEELQLWDRFVTWLRKIFNV